MWYLVLKALHVIAIIAWMAGLLYLPRLFVYHAEAAVKGEASETFKIMERRLLMAIMTPAMILSWVLGLGAAAMIGFPALFAQGWFAAKLALVLALTVYHFMLAHYVKKFAGDANMRPGRFFRAINEVPTLLMIGIVFLVIVRPF